MNKVTILTGAAGSGKTTLAMQMCLGKKTVWLKHDDRAISFIFKGVKADTELIVLDALNNKRGVTQLINSCKIVVFNNGEANKIIDRPEIIITSNCFSKKDFEPKPFLQIIDCSNIDTDAAVKEMERILAAEK